MLDTTASGRAPAANGVAARRGSDTSGLGQRLSLSAGFISLNVARYYWGDDLRGGGLVAKFERNSIVIFCETKTILGRGILLNAISERFS